MRPEGTTRVSANGYHYTKVNGTWRLTHHIVMEEVLGRSLLPNERVCFNSSDKLDLRPENLRIQIKGTVKLRQKKDQLEARIEDLQRELDWVNEQLERESRNHVDSL